MKKKVEKLKNYINGEWCTPITPKYLDVENPSTGSIISQVPISTNADVDKAAKAATEAFKSWSKTPVYKRCLPLQKLSQILRKNQDKLAEILVTEMGKSIPDAIAEIKRLIENCEVATGMPIMSQGDKIVDCSVAIDGEVLRLPVGVFGMIAPFNFPAMVPFWFLPYAVATGNTFILKPSELVPLTMNQVMEWIDEVGFPPGVVNMVHGTKEASVSIVEHELINGVSVVGRSETCRAIKTKCAELNKRCIAMGGAKNHLVVMPDAHLDQVIRNMATSCYGCAGQRCMAASVIVAVGNKMYKNICKRFIEDSKNIIVANPLDPAVKDEPMVMGPVINHHSQDFLYEMIEEGIKEGAKLALDGRNISIPGCENGYFIGPTVFTDVTPDMRIYKKELFGPVVCIMKVETLDEAIALINNHRYGNGASIYTQNGYYARKFKMEAQAGMIGVNIGIPAPVAYMPFGGMKDSLHADIKAQGKAIIDFYTNSKVITERYFQED